MSELEPTPRTPFFRPVQQALFVIALSIAIAAFCLAAYSARWILLATTIGIGLGVLLSPFMDLLKRKLNIPHGVGAALVFVVMIGSLVGLSYLLIRVTVEQVTPAINQFPSYVENAQHRIAELLHDYPSIQRQVRSLQWSALFRNSFQTVLSGLQLGVTAVAGITFVLTVALYFAANPKDYIAGTLSLFPAHMRRRVQEVMQEGASTLRRWFGAQLIAMATVGTITSIGLLITGVDYWFALGVLTAALDIIPYLGPITAWIMASLLTLGSEPDKLVWVFVVYVVAQQLEADLVIPIVMKGRIRLPPIHLLTLMLVFGNWFGVIGVLIAPPLFAVARTIYLITYVPRMNRQIRPTIDSDSTVKKSA